ncbi:epiplakin [Polymixia lowei]
MCSITQDIVIKQNGHTKHLGSVAGIFLEKTKEKINIYQAMKKHLVKPGTALSLLEAQAATGGIIDPINNGKLPVEDAVKEGIIGPEMKEKLQAAEKAVSGYIDPYTNETISIFQAIQKDLVPKDYGLRLLEAQISTQGLFDPVEKRYISVESAIEKGYYEKGLLSDQMEELRVFYNPNSQETLNYQHLQEKCVVEPKTGLLLLPVHITFRGLRRGVSSAALLESNIIDKQTFDDLQKGKTTTQDVMLMESVKEYLEGKGSISGVALLSTNERMSIFQAMKEGILMPGTALVLLEAQAATGFMIDPVENKKFSVDEAIKHKLVSPKFHAKLLSAEQAVTGYKDPYSGETISLFQALSKDLIVKEHGIRLLEAQIATGGIIDPINSHRLPVEVAYKRGYFTEDMNSILDDPTDDTKGFFDPNTKENLTYLQLLERCVIDPATGLCLLPLHDKSDKLNFNFIDYQAKLAFKEVKVKVTCGKYMGMTVSLWELLMSEYFDEHQRQDIIQKYKQGKLTIKVIITTVLEVIEKSVKTTKVIFEGIRETVTAKQLVEADIITNEVLEELEKGKKSVKEVTEDENVNMYLRGKNSIAGILLPDSQIMTIYQAKQKGKLMPGTALILLEAQAATGFIIDPIGNRKFSVDEAVKAKIIGPDVYQKLLSAEKAVTGYKDPYDSKILSLFQAMQKDLILQEHGIRLLEAQIATGGIIDPVNSHRIPVHVAYKRGYFNQEMNQILSDPTDDSKGFFDPNNHDNLTYLQLMSRCVTDPSTGLCLLPLKGKMTKINIDNNIKETFTTTTVTVRYGRFSGKHTTLWDLINSEYLSEDKRQDLFKLYKSRKITVQQIIVTILEIIESREIKQQAALDFEGLRGEVSVVDLLKLEIVDEKTYSNLIDGKLTSTEVMKMDSVRAYLQGKSCVAGVILQPSNQKLSIYEAQKKGIVTPGTALCLLEAQAATGFIVDPLKNKKFTVEQALKEKVIGPQVYEKLLSAERAVTGYKDPYTDKKISLFQALKKDLIVKQHAIRLLEAQIATGGIIDPLKCLHLPLEVAYREGHFDTELNQILSDPSDDTKGFFDPKTQENLTYSEMLGRCIKDTQTGLFLLPMNDNVKATGIKEKMYTDTEIKQEFEKRAVSISVGLYSGKSISLWELIHSGYFTDDQRLDLMEKYRAKKITTQSIITLVISTITKLEKSETLKTMGLRKPVSAQHLLDSDIIDVNTFKSVEEEKLSLEEVTQRKSVRKYLNGTSSIAGIVIHPSKKVMSIYEAKTQGLLTPGISLTLLEAQAATGYIIDPVNNKFYTVDEAARQSIIGPDVHEELLSAEQAVTGYVDPYTDTTISLFEAMSKDLIVKSRGIQLLETQIATGGIIDPIQSHRLPVHVALKKGYFDEGMNKILSDFNDDTKGFFDPNTKENITYLQLMKQCETDRQTGLLLLPLYEEGSRVFHTDEQTELTLKSKTVAINVGKFKGKQVPLWEVLISEYISKQKREQLLQQYKKGAMTIEEIIEILTVIITEVTSKEMKFKGLRKQVSASELYESKIITKELFTQIIQGKFTEDNVNKMESVQKYLGATNCIAGVRVESAKKVMSIYEAKTKGLLTPGTSLVLLEAQAATGFIIDPLNNKRHSVEEAVAQGVVGNEWKNKLLSAERAVTGYKDPYTGNTISLFQALKKDLIVKDHGIRLLEAQIATGGIIDPVYSHRVPVEVAYQRGYFDEEMNQILSDPDDDTKGFFDPNTQENLTYLQLVERCVRDPITGLSLLVIVKKGEFYFFVDEATKLIMKSTTTTRAGGKYQGQTVSLWDLLYSKYITEEKMRELVQQYKSGAITIEHFLEIILTIIQQQTTTTTTSTIVTCQPLVTKSESSMTKSSITTTTTTREISQTKSFRGIRKDVTAAELLESKIIDEDLYKDLSVGKVTVSQVSEMDSVHKYLEGTNSIAGVYLQSTQETMSIYEAKFKSLLTPGTSLVLLEAQAATGFVIDPVNNKRYSVEEAVAQGVVGNEWKNKLLSAERAVTGYKDPYTENTISLFQALKKDLIVKDHGIRLLEAQIATGGIIDPVYSHRVPVEVAYQRGYFDEEMNQILSDPDDDTKGFFDPNTQENLTYLQLVERCVRDPITGLSLLVIVKKGEFYFFVDEATKLIMKSTTTTRAGGKYQGQTVSLWDLLYSKYITEEKRRELVQQYKSGAITIERFLEIILTIIQQQTTTTTTSTIVTCQPLVTKSESSMTKSSITTTTREISQTKSFRGIRKDVTAAELLESKIIDEDLYKDLSVGKVTVSQVSEMDSVHKYLEGTNSIAGVYLQSTQETMSIYEAKFKSLLTPGTSLVLLEAQAATGFVIDPVNNKRYSVEEAVAQGVVGNEWKNKLLSAERAVTGYKDPYTENTISLFQALKKDLIVKDHGIRLLEAQIATGGIIDPVHSHRVPVEVAYQRGYFDEEMNQILSDPDDDTKGFFDPNTQENLTYLQLVERCVRDPITGLSLLVIVKKGEFYFFVDEATKLIMKSTTTTRAGGKYQGQTVSLWDLLYSKYITEEKRRELVQQYKSGAITIERFLEIILTIIQQQTTSITTTTTTTEMSQTKSTDEQTELTFMSKIVDINAGKFQGKQVPLWEVLFSEYISEQKREQLLQQYKKGAMTIEEIIEILTVIITEVTSKEMKFKGLRKQVSASELYESKIITYELFTQIIQGEFTEDNVNKMESIQKYLGATNCIAGVRVESTKKVMSIYEAKTKGLLTPGTSLVLLEAQAATGFIIDPLNNKRHSVEEAVAQGVVGNAWKNKLLSAERAVTGYKDPYTGNTISLFQALKKDLIVKDHGIRLLEAQIATGGIIDPVHSHRVPVQVAYQRGYFDEEMNQILSDPDDDTKGFFDPNTQENLTYLQLVERCVRDPITGLSLLVIVKKGEFYFFVDEATKLIMKSTTTTRAGGKYQGQTVSLWDLLYSKYITEEKRRELVQQYKSGAITIERFLEIILTIIQQQTTTTTTSTIVTCQPLVTKSESSMTKSSITTTTTTREISKTKSFRGIRKDVTAAELLESKIIDEDLYKDLSVGKVTVSEVSEMDSVHKYLEGTNSIAGVYLQSTQETMSIYEAKLKSLLTPGTSLVLLEAQAATGFVIDPVNNKRYSVEEAVAQGVVGNEWKNKLISAERAVTGYKDPYTENTISLFQALKKDLIVKDHGIRLLEAQIATGGIIDPVHSHRVPVEVAYQRGYFDEEMNQILSDPDDDTKGFFDPNTQENLTYLQLVERCIRDPITGLSLLVIVKKGEFYFFVDEATKLIMKSTTTTRAGGKYQGQTVSLWDLLYSKYITEQKRRELVQQYKSGAITFERFLEIILTIIQQQTTSITTTTTTTEMSQTKSTDEQTELTFMRKIVAINAGKFQGKQVPLWEVLFSEYISEQKREQLLQQYKKGAMTIEEIIEILSVIITEVTSKERKFKGLRKQVSASELYESKIITKELFTQIIQGELTEDNVNKMESIQKYLGATNCIAGVRVESAKKVMSIYEAKTKGLLTPGTSLVLLEAQAATGFVIDPLNNKRHSVEEAVAQGVVGNEWKNKLLSAERAVTGYKDPYTGNTISLFQALKKDLIVKDHGIRLLEAQIATGGIIDPVYSHRVPVEVAYQRGYFDEEMNQILSDPDDDTKGFFDPNTQENLTYLQLVERCVRDPITGLSLLVIVKKGEFYFFVDEATKLIMKSTTTTRAGGKYQGQTVSLWDLLYSKYITEEKRRELVQKYKSGAITIERFLEIILTIIQQQTTTTTTSTIVTCQPLVTKSESSMTKSSITTTTTTREISQIKSFRGIRKDVTAVELLESKIIDEDLYKDLSVGKVTVSQVSEMDSVHKYLEGTNSIAGVYLQSTQETMSIYEAKLKSLLTPGTSLVLLEAQAATGFVIDPVNNKRYSVEEAVAQGVVGNEWKNKLISAERAVTGYKDPYTENTISLFQALKKDLIIKDHGIRLLEAQIATGGIIDPVHSHRVPVEVAYQRGYFDEEMNQILSDPDDDTKGFFDPNTQENLTYLQLVERCIRDPITGLSLLVIVKKGEFYFFVDEATKLIMKSTTTTRAGGKYQGQTVSLWDLLYSKYITEEKRRELVQQYKSGAITIERFLEIILTIIQQQTTSITTTTTTTEMSQTKSTDEQTELTFMRKIVAINAGKFQGKQVPLWEVLFSEYISEQKREQLLQQYKKGAMTIEEIIEILSVIITEVTSKERKFKGLRKQVSASELYESKIITKELFTQIIQGELTEDNVNKMESIQKYLGATNCIAGVRVESAKKVMSIYEAKTKGLLTPGTSLVLLEAQAATGFVIDPLNNKRHSVEEAVAQGVVGNEWKNKLLSAERAVTGYKDPYTGNTISLFQALKKDLIVKDHGIRLLEAQIATGGIIDPVYSHRVPVEVAYQRGYFDEEMNQILSDPDDDTKGFFDPNTQENLTYLQLVERCVRDPITGLSLLVIVKKGEFYFFVDEATKLIMKSTTTTRAGGKYQGQTVSLWDLLYSKHITEEKRRELVQQYKSGAITIERFLEIILTIIQQQTTTTTTSTIVTCQPLVTKSESSMTKSSISTTTTTREISQTKSFRGIRKDVTAVELLESKIIDEDLYKDLSVGKVTVSQVSEMDSVHKYLEGTNSIAGVYLQSTQETMSIYEAKLKSLLTPGTSLVLLEAQAATGFVIDPVNNKRYSVEEAVAQGVVGNEWKNKLISAERAVTGYKDPYTENTISLFQALKKDLIVKDHGIRLLEAQIATGGIIDPVHSHRVPVEVAYQRGYFDEEMNQILSDPDDDTKGFFDPNTQENLTYLQLVERCIRDPITGLSLLVIVKKGEFYFFVDEATKLIMKSTTTTRAGGKYQGQTVSLWDLLYSKYITEEKRRELVQQYKSGAITIERFLEIILTIIQQQTTSITTTTTTTEMSQTKSTDEQTELTFMRKIVAINAGKFQGKQVPLWEVLFSEYISEQKREQLLQQYKKGAMTIEEIIEILSVIITEVTSKERKFKGLRKQVSASELYESKIITKELFTQIIQGELTEDNVNKMESIQRYLGATNCIAGVRVESAKKVMSIYEAKTKGLLTPGTSLVLLEAQAATGFVIDPLNNKRHSVEEAVAQGVVGNEWKNKLLSAERAVTGYKDPYTGNTISLFQALKKDLIVKDHGIRLLEAQIATGGIIDPVYSHRVPVEVAYQRGYFDEEMNQILSDPDDDTKGFFDPNTQENLTYLQLVERCVRDPITGLSLLVIVKKGEFYFFVDEATKLIMKSTTTTRAGGKYQGQTVSLWDLLYSKYITEEKRRELVQKYKSGAITIERFLEIILTIIQQQTTTTTTSTIVTCQPLVTKSESSMTKSSITTTTTTREISKTKSFRGIRKDVTAAELLESKIIDEDLYKDLSVGKVTVSQVSEMDSVHKYLEGTNSIAGVYLQSTKETMSIYEAKSRSLLTPGTSLVLLEAQAATGFVIDPMNNKRHSVEEAVAQGVVGNEWKNKLLSAERAVTGYKDPYKGNTISLFQALKKDLIVKDHGIRLLEAQIATGGIIDPVHSHRVPVQVAYQRGYFDEEMNQILSDPDDDTKGFFDPNTRENLTYLQLVERCVRDPITGLSLLVIVKKGEFYFFVDEATKLIMKSTTTTRAGGKYQGQTVSLWDLLYSKYITEEKRRELVQQYKSGAITIERFLEIILTIIQQQTTTTTTSTIVTCQPLVTKSESSMTKSSITTTTTTREISQTKSFRGIRKDVTAAELLESKIIDEDLYKDLSVGKVTVSQVSEMDSVHKYLEGTNSIAGVYLQSTQETMSIYEAKFKSLLTPGTSLVLLEAQAATGFVIDPVNNKRHSVEEAVAQGVVGKEWKNKLLSAERAVTGYKDPYTGNTISLFQALKKDLIVKDHGIRLLEAQIATGGIIDPVYSHRVPVEVAYQRGYFDEEMNQILSDPDDDTKGFFDPNTQENLTYLQLVERCVRDPITGLSLLVIVKKGEFYFFVDEATKLIMKSTTTTRAGGKYQGQTVSLWDLLYSKHITEEKRRELVQQYKSGAITIERFLEIILTIIQQQTTFITTVTTTTEMSQTKSTDEQTELTFMSKIVDINAGKFQGKQVPLWEVLFSEYISEQKREQLLQQYRNGAMTIEEVIEILIVIINEVTSKERKFKGLRKQVSASELYESKIITKELFTQIIQGEFTEDNVNKMESIQKYLGATNCIAGVRVESTKKVMSIYEAMNRGLLTPGTSLVLLEAQAATGFIIDPLNNKRHSVEEAVAQGVVGNAWKNKLLSAERAVTGYKDPCTGNTISLFQALKMDLIVKDHGIRLLEAQIATGGIIDPVHSHRVPIDVAYQRGYFDEEMNQILSDPDDDTKGFFDPNTQENLTYIKLLERCVRNPKTGLSLLPLKRCK